MFFAIPIELEAEYLLTIWLKTVPDHAVIFTRLAIIGIVVNVIGNTGYTACMATGNIKRYVLWITSIGLFVFPLTWISYTLGFPVEIAYILYILIYILIDIVRLFIMRGLLNFPISYFVKRVIIPVVLTSIVGVLLPLFVYLSFEPSIFRFLITICVSVISIGFASCYIGLTKHERGIIIGEIITKIKR